MNVLSNLTMVTMFTSVPTSHPAWKLFEELFFNFSWSVVEFFFLLLCWEVVEQHTRRIKAINTQRGTLDGDDEDDVMV